MKKQFVQKIVGPAWVLQCGAFYLGMIGCRSALVGRKDATVFDSRDNPEIKIAFAKSIYHAQFNQVFC